jgi:hypothetical protein
MTLTIKYHRKDFFGRSEYNEDSIRNTRKEDLKKALLHFSKNNTTALEIGVNDNESIIIVWDSYTEFENRIALVRYFEGRNYTDEKKSYDKVKKELYSMISE